MPKGQHSIPKQGKQEDQRTAPSSDASQHPTSAPTGTPYAPRSSADYRSSSSRNTSNGGGSGLRVAIIIIALLVIIFIVGGIYFCAFSEDSGDVATGEEITVVIDEGSTAQDIADLLKEDGVIDSSSSFLQHLNARNQADALQAGTYILTGGDDFDSIIDTLVSGKTGYYDLTIPEGYTREATADLIDASTSITSDEFLKASEDASVYVDDYSFLKEVGNGDLEGFLFPDTYHISEGADAEDLVRQMLNNFSGKLNKLDLTGAEDHGLSFYETVVLASIVEKEYDAPKDLKKIASVFYNRLDAGMALGSDVTTYYAVGKELTEDLTQEDLDSKSPYNTRNPNNVGLPPGPICSPSFAALKATAKPADTKYLYFFYSASEDKTMFFKSDKSFNEAWAKYGS